MNEYLVCKCGALAWLNKKLSTYFCCVCGRWYPDNDHARQKSERRVEEQVFIPGPYPAVRWSGQT